MSKNIKLCKDCYFAEKTNRQQVNHLSSCFHPIAYMDTDPVTGKYIYATCRDMRTRLFMGCGKKGKLFKARGIEIKM